MLVQYFDTTKEFHVMQVYSKKIIASSDTNHEAVNFALEKASAQNIDYTVMATIHVVKPQRTAVIEGFRPQPTERN